MDEATLRNKIGLAIRERRTARGFSQDTFADEIGMHRAYYGSIERGERNLTISTIWRVCRGLHAKLSDVLKEAGL